VKTLLLGLGNELYGDDGVGIHVVRKIKEDFQMEPDDSLAGQEIHVEESSLSGLALLDIIVGYDRLILVDTIKRPRPVPGRIHVLKEKDIRAIPGPSPHYVSVPQTIEIGRRLGLSVPSKIEIIGIEAKNIHHLGENLSPELRKQLPAIIRKVKSLLG